MVEISTIRLLLSYAASRSLKIYQADVPTAYVNVNLSDKIFVKQPTAFKSLPNEDIVFEVGDNFEFHDKASPNR